jgi:hypothetical protein
VVLLAILILMAGGAGIAWYQLGGKLRSTEPYKAAWGRVQNDPQVIAQLGQPIHEVWLPPSGSVYGENANLTFKIEGPKGRAAVQADARRFAGKWELRVLNVTFADQKRISIDTASGEAGEGDAPRWTPSGGAAPKAAAEAPKIPAPASPGPDIQLDMPDVGSPQKPPDDAKPAKK